MINRFDRNLRLGYGVSILILLVVSLVSYLTLQNLLASNRLVEHSGKVMQKFEKVLSVMKDAETGQRGYLLSGNASYLEPYNGAYQQALQLTGELTRLTADNPRQQQNIALIEKVLRQRLAILQQLVDKKQRFETIVATDLDAGKSAMDALRQAIARAEHEEQELLKTRTAKLNHYTTLAPALILLAALAAIGITLYSYRNVTRDYREKEKLRRELEQTDEETQALNEELTAANEEVTATNEELARINETLEQRVAERTRALQDSEEETQALNEELMAINEEMTATNEELQAANEELRAADERSAKLAAIVESSDDAIIGKDLNGIITAWNRGASQIFGYSEGEMIGQSILKLIPENLQHEEPGILARLRQGEKIDHYETVRRTQDGRLINVSLTISPIHDKEGRVTGVSKIARDITEQKQDDQRKNDFIGMASHELKTPLTTLTAIIQVLQQKYKDTSDVFLPQALNKANTQTRKMSSLITGFLNISRLESGKLEISKTEFDLADLINEQVDEIRLTVGSHNFYFDAPGLIPVLADYDKIGSVISNLLSNAVKYSPKGKQVFIKAQQQTDEVVVSVQDEGMGIRSKDLPHIFDRYYRAGSEHTKHISGFGVGLYLCAEIIHRHDGRIWAESEKGVGSTFFFTLPI
ncbi:CHASE3 domain-containing protein [Mucilaginibacter sp. UR6-11]|uniref:sensor histidine kinase n=1 Tax=Mucilaginibacter sp. UR6-11 TaxID=1435644 RepID=UPI001E612D1A|nr:CHASE3 domain-containing protein [Mucilaginibacter sp. UR6-11]MCC8424921.1 CHASE3 domain-containing protein [Mucilaginibacter sp. UR6-11]